MIRDEPLTTRRAAPLIDDCASLASDGVDPEDESDDDALQTEHDFDIQDILHLLDQVWPREDSDRERVPRQFGRFLIEGELGRGGFGVVYLAEDPLLKRRVALKLPMIGIVSGTESWRRFLREAQAASRLDHPNVIPLLEAGTVGPLGYIVSAYVPGPSLEQWLRHNRRPVSPRWGAQVVVALARAMEHAHQRGILHRDLKPANVLLYSPECEGDSSNRRAWEKGNAESWLPRICDFGMAKLREVEGEETRSRVACGSPPYMAPEQAEARQAEIGTGTDVYGLGAILYQILTGRPPFSGKNDLETLRLVVEQEPAALRTLRPGVPRDLETICLKCLAKKPGQRYSSAAALADDLERFLDGRPISARPVAAWERGWRWGRRHPASASLAMAVVVALAAGLGGLLWHNTRLGKVNEQLHLTVIMAEANAQEARSQKSRAEAHQRLLGRQLAAHQIFGAQQAVTARDFERAFRLIDAAGPELGTPGNRGFAWTYLRQKIRARVEIFSGHRDAVNWIAASPDGRSLASGDHSGEIRLWDLATGACRPLVSKECEEIQHLLFSPDSRDLAAATSEAGEVFVWDALSGRLRAKLAESDRKTVSTLLFSNDGGRLAAVGLEPGRDGLPFECWNVRTATGNLFPLAPDDRSTRAALLTDSRLQSLVDLMDDSPLLKSGPLAEFKRSWVERAPRGVARTRDQSLAMIARGDGAFEVFELASRRPMATGLIRAGATAMVMLRLGNKIDQFKPRQFARVEILAEQLGPDSSGERQPSEVIVRPWFSDGAAAFSPNGRLLAFWAHNGENGLKIIDLTTGLVCATFDLGPINNLTAMTFTTDSASVAFGDGNGKVLLWHLQAVQNPESLGGHAPKEAWSVAFSPDGKTLASGGDDSRIRLWDVETGEEKAVLRGHYALVSSVAFAPDGRTLASASYDTNAYVALWDVATRTLRSVLRGHTGFATSVSFSPDGRTFATTSHDGSVLLWDVASGRRSAPLPPRPYWLTCAVFSPDGQTLASSYRFEIMLTNLVGGGSRSIDTGNSEVLSLVYSPDGSHLTSGHGEGLIKTWEVATGRQTQSLPGHSSHVFGLALSPDGRTLASAGGDRTVRLWDTDTGQELLCLTDCKARVNSVAFSPDGSILAAADHTGAITLWRARPQD